MADDTSLIEPRYSDQDIDDALNAAQQQADAAEDQDEYYAAGWRECAEFFHRYLRERNRLTNE
jgi:hypothetical protein